MVNLLTCLLAAALGQLFFILYNTRDHLKTRAWDWTTWKRRNLPETIIGLALAVIAAFFFHITEYKFFTATFGLDLNEYGKPGACFIVGLLLDTVINVVSKVGIRKPK